MSEQNLSLGVWINGTRYEVREQDVIAFCAWAAKLRAA